MSIEAFSQLFPIRKFFAHEPPEISGVVGVYQMSEFMDANVVPKVGFHEQELGGEHDRLPAFLAASPTAFRGPERKLVHLGDSPARF